MTSSNKLHSIRCDMHPPMSASMFCDSCRTFLCKICAEVRLGSRVCTACQKVCRQPSPDEWDSLVAGRAKTKDTARLAKESEGRVKVEADRVKQERDAKLKAEFAAKKQEWAQAEAAKKAQVQQSGAALGRPASAVQAVTSYEPTPFPTGPSTDPLYKLGERGHIATINNARNWMLAIAILSMLYNGVMFYLVVLGEKFIDGAREASIRVKEERAKNPKKRSTSFIKTNVTERELAEAAADRAEADEVVDTFGEVGYEQAQSAFFWAKLILFIYFAVGVALFILYFRCVDYPKQSTQLAFILYAGATAIDLILMLVFKDLNLCALVIRAAILAALFQAMQSGKMLYEMRVRNGEVSG